MPMDTTHDAVVVRLRRAGARFAFVHGSRAKGEEHANSDLDVAAWWGSLAPAPWDVDVGEGVDLLVLDDAPLELAGRVALHGVLLFDDDPAARVRWQAQTRLIYLDEEDPPARPGPSLLHQPSDAWLTNGGSAAFSSASTTTSPTWRPGLSAIGLRSRPISTGSIEEEIFRIMPSAAGYVAVVGFHHEYLGEEVGLYVHERLFADTALSRGEFVAAISAMHDAFRPRALYVSDEPVSTTFSGKAQRPKMKDCFAGASDFLGELRILSGSSLPPTPSSH